MSAAVLLSAASFVVLPLAPKSPCTQIEGRARITRSRGTYCARLGTESCDRFYETDPTGKEFRLCRLNASRKCEAAKVYTACSVEAVSERNRQLLGELRGLAEALKSRGTDASFEEATISTAEAFEVAIAADVMLPLATSVNVLKAAAERADPFGWMDGAHTLEEVALQLPVDEAIGVEAVLLSAIDEATHALERSPAGWRTPMPNEFAAGARALGVSADGWFIRDGDGEGSGDREGGNRRSSSKRIMVTGFNALDHHLGVSPEGVEELAAGTPHLPAPWQKRLSAWGVNVISLQLPLAKLLEEELSVNYGEIDSLVQHIRWAASNNMSIVLHLSHYMPKWASEQYADLTMNDEDAQHGVHYDIDHPFASVVLRKALRGLSSRLGCPRNLVGIELANEPAFRVTFSRHAKKAFEQWLRTSYHGNLAALRSRWGEASLSSFASASTSAWRTDARFHGEPPKMGSHEAAKLADWSLFNDARVLRWTKLMVESIREGERVGPDGSFDDDERDGQLEERADHHDDHPGSQVGDHANGNHVGHLLGERGDDGDGGRQGSTCLRTFMRLNNALLLDPRIADHGIDRSSLARVLDIHGFDSNYGFPSQNGHATSFDTPTESYDTRHYIIDWLNYYGALTLLRSMDPSKPLFDAYVPICLSYNSQAMLQ